jgi:hypothetical protein
MNVFLVLLLLSQTTYEWTDKAGVVHVTDNPSTVPSAAKVKTTERAVDSGRRESKAGNKAAGTVQPSLGVAPSPNACVAAKAKVAALEADLEKARAEAAQSMEAAQRKCQEKLNTLGPAVYAQCRAGLPSAADLEKPVQEASKRIEEAKDELRRVQVSGCQ